MPWALDAGASAVDDVAFQSGPMQNTERRALPRTCDTPFERGPLLCSVCRMAPEVDGLKRCSRMVVDSPVMRALMVRAAQIAASEAPVVILGESGTGKEVLARAIHANSPRKRKPFVAVNVARHVEEGRFRADLYYRLKVFALRLPPLRERVEDIEPLVHAFLEGAGRELSLSKEALAALEAYAWPGNIRELSNAILHATTLCTGDTILPAHLPEELFMRRAPARAPTALVTLEEVEREHIGRVLEACTGNRAEAARVLGIGRNTLWRKLRAYGFDA